MLSFALIAAMLLFFLAGSWHESRREKAGRLPGLFQQFWHNAGDSFRGRLLLLQLAVIPLTALIVCSGSDALVQDTLQRADLFDRRFLRWMLIIGNIWHLLPAFALWALAVWRKLPGLRLAAFAALQALFINALINTLLKLLTGRRGPANPYRLRFDRAPFRKTTDPLDFDFAFWNHHFTDGRFFWPSGHTASIFAFVTALTVVYPEKKWIPLVGYPLSLFTALSMVAGDFHWTSDVVAGACGGIAVGIAVGRHFRKKMLT